MRPVRTPAFALILALLALVPASALSQAAAPGAHVHVASLTSHPTTSSRTSAQTVKVGATIRRKDGGLYMMGNVTPAKGPVVIQKATKCNMASGVCNFSWYKKVGLKKGRYETQVKAPTKGNLYWQAHVGSNKSSVWVTCKTTTTSC